MDKYIDQYIKEENKLITSFGSKSNLYKHALNVLKQAWNSIDPSVRDHLFSDWRSIQLRLYGETSEELFLIHTYLVWLMRIIRHLFFKFPLEKYSQEDVFSWIWNNKDLASEFIELLKENVLKLRIENISRDIFKELYEEIISKELRVRRGEYNTPDWLAQLILSRVLAKCNKLTHPKILDPACGTGTFLFHAVKFIIERWGEIEPENIVGIDVNPVMVEIAKTNYLLAIGEDIFDKTMFKDSSQIPIFCFDTLFIPSEYRYLEESFDIVVGNPPWGSLRDIKNTSYQNFIKNLAIKIGFINKNDTHLFTQIEIATIFYIHCIRFLRHKGLIAFIMPKSVILATMQNYKFIRSERLGFRFIEILDLENVRSLFNIPSCVIIGEKNGKQVYPIRMIKYTANLGKYSQTQTLDVVMHHLTSELSEYYPSELVVSKRSKYYDKFKTGVSIFPRSFYFVDIVDVIDNMIKVKSSDEIVKKYTKEPWKVILEGLVERDFLYYTLLAWELIPYFYVKLRPVILPILKEDNKFKLLKIEDMINLNMNGIANWFKKVDEIWKERRTLASEKRFPSIFDRLNYCNLLEHQSPKNRYIVLYNATGRNLVSCIIDRHNLPPLTIKGKTIKPIDFIADVKTWLYETNNLDEALYLCGVLNSDVVNDLIKPLQPRGLGGERAIHRRPLMLNIPMFNPNDELHKAIVKYAKFNFRFIMTYKTKNSRKNIRKVLPYQDNINKLVKKLLGGKLCQ